MNATLLARTARTAHVLARVPGERRMPFASRERLLARRDARVRELVRYAAETVPFYRDVFRSAGIRPEDIRTADDLFLLPVVDRDVVRADPGRFRSESRRAIGAVRFQTTGTTGLPVCIYHDRSSVLENMAFGERERVVEAHLARKRARYRILSFGMAWGSTASTVQAENRRATLIPALRRVRVPLSEPFDGLVRMIDDIRPDVIRGPGSHLEAFFRLLVARGARVHLPRVVVYGSDMMSRECRALMEERLGVPVISRYNSVECFKIGFVCEERGGFHVHEDLCHVRVLRPDGSDAAPGEVGEVAVSNLVNRGTVLINYRLGDLATLAEGSCSCGRELRLLSDLEGRTMSSVRRPDGSFAHEGWVWLVVRKWPGVIQFQLVQQEATRFELRLSTATPGHFEEVAAQIAAELEPVLGEGSTVDPVYCDELTPGPRGKFRNVVPLRGGDRTRSA
jgi:phenylacetate-coenzyme A ligase PaaK-like adenylate-forming protein